MRWTRRKFVNAAVGAGALARLGVNPAGAESPTRIRKKIPTTGEKVSPVGIGTNRYAVGTTESEAPLRETLRVFAELGGNVIDTAPRYRTSETVLGRLIDELKIRKQLFLATKNNLEADDGGGEQMAGSLTELRTGRIDLMQSHNLHGVRSMLPVMREWKEAGQLRYLGITTSRNVQFDQVIKLLENEPLDFLQINYSLADREAAEKILPLALDKNVAVLINVPFGRGRLFSAVGDQPLPEWSSEFDCTSWAHFFLKYVISHPAVTCAIPGTTKPNHAVDNQGAALGRLPDADERRRQEIWFDAL